MALRLGDERKGYAGAVIDGLSASRAPYVLAVDSDGQCDPIGLLKIWRQTR